MLVNLWDVARRSGSGGNGGDMTIENDNSSRVKLSGHVGALSSLLMDEQGSILVSSSEDGTVKVWDTPNKQCIQTIELNKSVTCLCPIQDGDSSINTDDNVPIAPFKRSATVKNGPSYLPFKRLNSNQDALKA